MARSRRARVGVDSIRVTWYNGLSGPAFLLALHGDSLHGTLVHRSDIIGASPRTDVASAVRIACVDTGGTVHALIMRLVRAA